MGFHEKSAWACLVAVVLVFVPYFVMVFRYPMAFVGLFVLAVVGLIALLTIFHIVNSLVTASIRKTGETPPHDELDRTIELRAAKLSGIVLGVVVVVWSIIAMYGAPTIGVLEIANAAAAGGVENDASQFAIPVLSALTAIHVLFAGFVAANVAYYGTIVAGYRRLAHG